MRWLAWVTNIELVYTVNREIFVVEKFWESRKVTKINCTKYFLRRITPTRQLRANGL